MADLLQTGLAWWAAQLAAGAARTVTYSRAGQAALQVTATVGRTAFRTTGANGRSVLDRSDRDYLIAPAEIDFGAGPVPPRAGDRITDGADLYEVYSPGGEPPSRSADPLGTLLRVHCRREV